MIEKVLIANRGEIALRVIKTCKALGIKTVAVYSDEDYNSLHVKQATEAYHIGEAAPAKSYLNQEKIIETILSSGADAIHPGYGFLSENSDFASKCEKNKINFIGPSAASMELCGDKMQCKAAMLKAKVPTVPGSPGLVKDVEEALKIANDISYPVLLKSVFGGGGRGIRLVNNDKELREGFETVKHFYSDEAVEGKARWSNEDTSQNFYRIPDNKRDTKVLHGEKRTSEVNLILDYLVNLKDNSYFKSE